MSLLPRSTTSDKNGSPPPRKLGENGAALAWPGAEHYDALLWRLCARRADAGEVGYLVGLTGCERPDGVSTLAANLAVRAAELRFGPVMLIDANFTHPQMEQLWRIERKAGFIDVLAGDATLAECCQPTSVIGLDLLTVGAGRTNACIDPQQVDALVDQLREQYSLVIYDLPPATELGQALLVARSLDAVVLVVRAERVARRDAQEAVDRLAADGVRVAGAIVTDVRRFLPNWLQRIL